jgi:hypothetical protein
LIVKAKDVKNTVASLLPRPPPLTPDWDTMAPGGGGI